jgi:hypothetical protein
LDLIAIPNRNDLPLYRVEDAGVAIWTKSLRPNFSEMPSFLYIADCADGEKDAVFISPVSAHEMSAVMENVKSGSACGPDLEHPFVLDECKNFRCRCWPPTTESCYTEFANDKYEDVIVRLL